MVSALAVDGKGHEVLVCVETLWWQDTSPLILGGILTEGLLYNVYKEIIDAMLITQI